jgi:RHS repeat-associated protein
MKIFSWTEDNRLQGFFHDKGSIAALYRYDASGKRELKLTATVLDVWDAGTGPHKQAIFDNATLYAGNLMTVSEKNYTKHYFVGSERLASAIGGGGTPNINAGSELSPINGNAFVLSNDFTTFVENYFVDVNKTSIDKNGIKYPADLESFPNLNEAYYQALNRNIDDEQFYFHSDHLGSGNMITDRFGCAFHTLAYAPHGEVLVNAKQDIWDFVDGELVTINEGYEPMQFGGYEKDEESGLSYAGARYYNSAWGIFTSPDAMWYFSPSKTSYHYCANNPIMYIDPDGNFATKFGAWLHRTLNGGGGKIEKNKQEEYHYSKNGVINGEITVSEVYGRRGYNGRGYKQKGGGVALQRIFDYKQNYTQNYGERWYGTGREQLIDWGRAKHLGPSGDASYLAPFGAPTPIPFFTRLLKPAKPKPNPGDPFAPGWFTPIKRYSDKHFHYFVEESTAIKVVGDSLKIVTLHEIFSTYNGTTFRSIGVDTTEVKTVSIPK